MTVRVSVGPGGVEANGASQCPALSDDGRYVAFLSAATNLVPGDTNDKADVFVRDLVLETTTRVSIATDGAQANGHSACPAISTDGRYVAFSSAATNLVPGDTNGADDAFVRDLSTATTRRVGPSNVGESVDISGDGTYVSAGGTVYLASTPVRTFGAGVTFRLSDTGRFGSVYGAASIRYSDLWTDTTTTAISASQRSFLTAPAPISGDGLTVAHTYVVAGLVEIFGHNLGIYEPSARWPPLPALDGYAQDLSRDGRYLLFASTAAAASGDTNSLGDLYLFDRSAGKSIRVSLTEDGRQAIGVSGFRYASLSGDARRVAFSSTAANITAGDANGVEDVFLTVVPLSAASVTATTVAEGGTATVTLRLDSPASAPVTLRYETIDGTAKAGLDYEATRGAVVFLAGETTQTFTVKTIGDTTAEATEVFGVRIASDTAATTPDTAQVVILDDDTGEAAPRRPPLWHDFFAVDTRETPYVGDFDGDGRTDLITFTRQNPVAFGDVYVSLSTGAGFGPNIKWHDWFAIDPSERVVIGDYNGDGKDDIATWLPSTGQVYVALSQGTGMGETTVWLTSLPMSATDVLRSGDVDRDGWDDLVWFARSAGKAYVATSSNSRFNAPSSWSSFFAVSTYERPDVADVDGDGRFDAVSFATDSPTAFGDVWVSKSGGKTFPGFANPSSKWHDWFGIDPSEIVRVGDVNGDGKTDFVTCLAAPSGACFQVLSTGTGMAENVLWPEKIRLTVTDIPFLGDVNGDGRADIIVFAQGEGRVYVSLSR